MRLTTGIDGYIVEINCDITEQPGYSNSSINIIGEEWGTILVPSIKPNGAPGFGGRAPTREDLIALATLHIRYWPTLRNLAKLTQQSLDIDGPHLLLDLAAKVGMEPPVEDGTFDWLFIVEAAAKKGVLPSFAKPSAPSSRELPEHDRFTAAAKAKAKAQEAYNAAFERHKTETTPANFKAKMNALAILSERCVEANAAQRALIEALTAQALAA
jgi:hypothetical protein